MMRSSIADALGQHYRKYTELVYLHFHLLYYLASPGFPVRGHYDWNG